MRKAAQGKRARKLKLSGMASASESTVHSSMVEWREQWRRRLSSLAKAMCGRMAVRSCIASTGRRILGDVPRTSHRPTARKYLSVLGNDTKSSIEWSGDEPKSRCVRFGKWGMIRTTAPPSSFKILNSVAADIASNEVPEKLIEMPNRRRGGAVGAVKEEIAISDEETSFSIRVEAVDEAGVEF